MKIYTRHDLTKALIELAEGNITIYNIEFNDYITDTIKIYSDNFVNNKIINFRTANIILSVQNEFIRTYNILLNKNISLNDIDKYKFLIVNFEIENGCIKILYKIAKKIYEDIIEEFPDITKYIDFFKNMTGNQKIIALFIILAAFGTWRAPEIIKSFRSNPEIEDILENNVELVDILAKNQQTTNVIINNLGDGYVEFDGHRYTADDYRQAKLKSAPDIEDAPVIVDDIFFIQKYDFKEQKVLIFPAGHESFWASTKLLDAAAREELKKATAEAIEKQNVGKERMRVACFFRKNRVTKAEVESLGGDAGTNTCSFDKAAGLSHKSHRTDSQLTLFEDD